MTNLVFVQYGVADPRHQHHGDEEGNESFPRHIDIMICQHSSQRIL